MGMLSRYREDRATVRAHTSALKSKAKSEAKAAAKEARRQARRAHKVELVEAKRRARIAGKTAGKRAKLEDKAARREAKLQDHAARRLEKTEAALAKADRKQLEKEAKVVSRERKQVDKIAKAGRKHEVEMAKMGVKQTEAGKFGSKDVQRWLGVVKTATPVLVPLLYKAVSQVGPTAPGGAADAQAAGIQASGPGAALGGRVVRLEQTLDQLDSKHSQDPKVRDFTASTRKRLSDLRTAVEAAEVMPTAQRREVHKSIAGEIDRVNRDVLARLGVKP